MAHCYDAYTAHMHKFQPSKHFSGKKSKRCLACALGEIKHSAYGLDDSASPHALHTLSA